MLDNYLSVLNRNPKTLDGPGYLHDLVPKSSPTNQPAIDFLENGSQRRKLTYGTLHTASDTLASRIRTHLSRLEAPAVVIPVLLPQSPELYVALLAILKSGRAFCPIGLDTPPDRLNFILNDISADLVITNLEQRDRIHACTGLDTLVVDCQLADSHQQSDSNPPGIEPTSLAYILYTSGSTGLPKAVSVSHRAVTQSLLAHHRHIPSFRRFLQFASPTFDVSIFEIFFPLYRGCTVVGCTRTRMLHDLPGTIALLDVDAVELTPTVVSNLLQGRKSVPGVKLLLTIGEMLTRDVIDEFGGHDTQDSLLWGMYGPTEAAIHCTLQPKFACHHSVGNIGFPLDTVTTIVAAPLSRQESEHSVEVLPLGETGELVIGGPQIAEEYYNRSRLTAESFFQDTQFGYIYRTGDKARLHPDGTIECLGRITSGQVKWRGQRLELGEIEHAILRLDGCFSAVVLIVEDTLVAFCAIRSVDITSTAVIHACKKWLPEYMAPTEVIILQYMPQLSSGKVDKQALRSLYLDRRQRHDSQHQHQSNDRVDDMILSSLRSVLGRNVAYDDDLTNLGLDSLRSIRISSALRSHGYNIGPVDVLLAQSVTDLCKVCITNIKSQKKETTSISIDSSLLSRMTELQGLYDDIADVLPCTPLQEAMLTETLRSPGAYCNWIEVELFGPNTFPRIQELLRELVQQNEILRSGFCMVNSKSTRSFVQIVWKRMIPNSVKEVRSFSRTYSLGSSQSLLHPFSVQVKTVNKKPRLLFHIHHSLYDGWSFELILKELSELLAGRAVTVRPQFREVVQHYLQLPGSGELDKSKQYWSDLLRGYRPVSFPNFNGKEVISHGLRSLHGESAVGLIPLSTIAKQQAVHPQVFFQTAISQLISLYVGVPEIVIGTVVSGRTIPVTQIEDIMGPCIASLPFRMSYAESSTIANLLHKTHQANREMLSHCTLSLREITRICKLRLGEPLFDVLFVWQQTPEDICHPGIEIVNSADDLEFKLIFEFEPSNEKVFYRVTYDPSILPERQVIYLIDQINQIVTQFVSNVDESINRVVKSMEPELLSIANPQPKQSTTRCGPSSAVERWALETPNKTALVLGAVVDGVMRIKESVSYASLNSRANQLAYILMNHDFDREKPICVFLEKSVNLYVSILAILKIGCGYLPIIPETPKSRIEYVLADAGVSICICDSDSMKYLPNRYITVIDIDSINFSNYPNDNPNETYHGSHLAYTVFTSGSTGRPKGVLVTQDNLMSNLEHLSSVYPIEEHSRLLQACSQAFDVSVFEIFFSWYVGICLCAATKDDLFYDLEEAIDRLSITHLSLTPTLASLVNPSRVPKVKFLVTAGEALTEVVKRRWAGKGLYQGMNDEGKTGPLIDNSIGYGPSETTNICTINPCVTSEDLISNIGQPFPNTSVLLLDPRDNSIVARGAIGELCFGGTQVFRGYLNRPDLNEQKIITHPKYGRIYRSGDTGRLLPDDSIMFLGRLDDQVKVRGQRVELGELTSIVLEHQDVRDCTAMLFNHNYGHQELVVFVVIGPRLTTEFAMLSPKNFRTIILDIFESMALQLPDYMIPTHIVPVSGIPMTSQTKVDRRLLKTTFDGLSHEELELTADSQPRFGKIELSTTEHSIAEALSKTLGIQSDIIGRGSSFFRLGLDSVSAIRFAKYLRDFRVGQPSVSTVLKHPTIERLAVVIESDVNNSSSRDNNQSSLSTIFSPAQLSNIRSMLPDRGSEVESILPCTPLQEAMLSKASTSGGSYFNTIVFNIHGELNRLQKCWEHMVDRHQILRTAFVPTDNKQYAFAQVITKFKGVRWKRLESIEDLQRYAEDVLSTQLHSHRPPVHFAIQHCDHSAKLVFCCHHALYDGIAIDNLLKEIQEDYKGKELSSIVSYEQYLQYLVSQDLRSADDFWAASFIDFQPTLFPNLSRTHPALTQKRGCCQIKLQISCQESLAYCRSTSTSVLSLIQATWAKLLHFMLGENDICFGNVVSGRTLPENDLERLIAPCFNTVPIRLKFGFQKPNVDLCRYLHTFNVDSMPFQLSPLRRVQTKVLRDKGYLFDTLVILQQPKTSLDGSIWSIEQDVGDMDVPIVCEVVQDIENDTLLLNLHYQYSLLQDEDAEILAEIFDCSIRSLVCFPDSPANDAIGFPLHLLGQSNTITQESDYTQHQLLHSAFEDNSIKIPEAIALDFRYSDGEATTFTFRDLNKKANQIAHALIQLGIQLEHVVPIHMPKRPEFYASVLGILKAGAAFSPIHPDLPTARKQYMLSELQSNVIISIEDGLDWAGSMTVLNVDKVGTFPAENPVVASLRPTNMAYCLYTSGSTGVPKAVSMEHRAPIKTIESSRSLIPWTPKSRLLQYAAVTFDMCYYDCFLAWSLGFTLCAASQDQLLNHLTDIINETNSDMLDLTPSVAMTLHRAQVPNAKWLYCIGEAMTTEIMDEWKGACINSYGPTETAFCTTIFPTCSETRPSVIGRPFPTTSFAVFAQHGSRPIPILSIGELYIGGMQLARGYYGQPTLTEQNFLQKCGQRFYRTGDVVRMLSDGSFEFFGRMDEQVKIRGLRVELGEINKVLRDCDRRVVDVTSHILRKNTSGKDLLVSFIVTGRFMSADNESALRRKAERTAQEHLPSYMVPQFILFLDKLPRSMAGKIDKRQLSNIFAESDHASHLHSGSQQNRLPYKWSRNENYIRSIFSSLSNIPVEDITPWTTIHQLGLDSISAVQIATALRKLDLEVKAADVMKLLTCQDLAAYVDNTEPSTTKAEDYLDEFENFEKSQKTYLLDDYGLLEKHVEAIRPCTPMQNGMLSQMITKRGAVYMNFLRLHLRDGVDWDRLNKAWNIVIGKHRMLRTGFAHTRNKIYPFAMVHYKEGVHEMRLQYTTELSDDIEEWLRGKECQVADRIDQPPWFSRLIHKGNSRYLDLALFHAIYDAQSLAYIFDDIATVYRRSTVIEIAPLEPVIGNILRLSNSKNPDTVRFWKRLGEGVSPTRFPNLAPLQYDPAPPTVLKRVSVRTIQDLDAGCRRSNISLQAAGIASWANLLSAYTGEAQVNFGVVLSGREIDDAEATAFPCITTVPFPCKVSSKKDEFLGSIMALNTEIQQYKFTPIVEVQRLMGFANEPIFDSIFAFQKLPTEDTNDKLWMVVDERAAVEYSLSIELEPKAGQLEFRLTFLPHVVPREHAALILEQFDHLLQYYIFPEATRTKLDQRLYSITPAKEPIILSEAKLLHEFVELTAKTKPTQVALEFVSLFHEESYISQQWSYAEVDCESNKVANMLVTQGIEPGDMVGICFEKCPEAYFAILGILKAGGAFVALDPGAPVARKIFIANDSGAKCLLSMKSMSRDFQDNTKTNILNLDEIDWLSISSHKPSLGRQIEPQDTCYCLYTSGTTGTPKGCEITHENTVQAMMAFTRLFAGHWDQNSRWFQFASFHFDVSVLEQYWSWSVGISVVSAPRDLIFEDLSSSLRILEITHIDLTPSLARILRPEEVPTLCEGVFITGGESLKQEILDVWGPKSVIYNGYGPTETTIGVTMFPRVPNNGKPSNIGQQFHNVGSFILQQGSDVPVLRGGVGELCISGKLVGKGYLNQPTLTDERFPYLTDFSERVYRTGDLVRILYDGSFDFLGRADDQVKLRGQRLEIGEINAVIKQSDTNVADVATLLLKHPNQEKEQIVSFIVTQSGISGVPKVIFQDTFQLQKVKDACYAKLPPYMVPTHFVALTTMPLSSNNKAEVKRLRAMYEALSVNDLHKLSTGTESNEELWTEQEYKIRDVIKETLNIGMDTFGKDVNFFELGMDSISVIGVSRILKQAGVLRATPSVILRNATIRQLTKVLSNNSLTKNENGSIIAAQQMIMAIQHQYRRTVADLLCTDVDNIEKLAPCTPLQQGMIARAIENSRGLYFNSFHFQIDSKVELSRLRVAWLDTFTSTQILRTAFVNTDYGFLQAVIRGSQLKITHVNLSHCDTLNEYLESRQKQWVQSNQPHIDRPIELDFIETFDQNLLVLHIFHGLYDKVSINMILEAVWKSYNGRGNDIRPSYHACLAYGPLRLPKDEENFWRMHLRDQNFRSFPSLSDKSGDEVVLVSRKLNSFKNLEATRRALNVTAQAIAQACWATVLHSFIKNTVTFGMVVSGRMIDFEDVDKVIGPLFNTIPFQYHVQRNETWQNIIKRVHDFNFSAHPYQHTSLRNIMKWCKRPYNQPLFDTLFVYQVAESDANLLNNDVWKLLDTIGDADYPLAIEIMQKEDTLELTLSSRADLSDAETCEKILDKYEQALRQAVERPHTRFDSPENEGHMAETRPALKATFDDTTVNSITSQFEWSFEGEKIRTEIAHLSGIEIEQVNANTSIYELGLDSIDAIKLSSKLKKQSIDLSVSAIMRSLTITQMLEHISATKDQKNDKLTSGTASRSISNRLEIHFRHHSLVEGIEKILPPTPLQEAVFAEMIASNYTRYYNHDVLKLKQGVELAKLQTAWEEVVKKSPILRTSFLEVDDPGIGFSFAQVVHRMPHKFWRSIRVDCEPDFNALFEQIRSEMTRNGKSEPLFHVQLLDTPQQAYMIISISHALYDGWSLRLLHSDVHEAYLGDLQCRPDYESALYEILKCNGTEAAAFWKDYLSGAKLNMFPRQRAVKVQKVHRQERISPSPLSDVSSFAKRKGIALQTLGLVAYSIVVASYTGSLDVTFGSVFSGRDSAHKSNILFPTMNTVAIRAILHGSRGNMLHYMQDSLSGIKLWQHFPLRKALRLARQQQSLFESLFIFQKSFQDTGHQQARLYESIQGQSDVEYPICVEMEVVGEIIMWRCAVDNRVFDKTRVGQLLDRLDKALEAIIHYPDAPTIDVTATGTSVCGLPCPKDTISNPLREEQLGNAILNSEHPKSPTAAIIREVLAYVSQTPEHEMKKDTTIFHIGLDSISAIKVSSLLRKRGIMISVSEMLGARTFEQMAVLVDGRASATNIAFDDSNATIKATLDGLDMLKILKDTALDENDVERILPITAGQLYMLSAWLNSSGTMFYPEFSYQIRGSISFRELQESWKKLIRANPILRAQFCHTNDPRIPYVQTILHTNKVSISDVTGWDSERISEAVVKTASKQPFFHVFASQDSDGWYVKIKIHHAIYDGVSLSRLMEQLQAICNGSNYHSQDVLPQVTATACGLSSAGRRRSFWVNYLKGLEQHLLPQPETLPTLKVEIFKPSALSGIDRLEKEIRKKGLTIQSLFLAVYSKLYAKLTESPSTSDIAIGIYLANRSLPILDIHQAAVPTMNLVPLRVSAPLDADVMDLAAQIQHDIQEISIPENALVSLWEVHKWTGIRLDTFVNFLKLPDMDQEQPEAKAAVIRIMASDFSNKGFKKVTETEVNGIEPPQHLRNERVNRTYLVSSVARD